MILDTAASVDLTRIQTPWLLGPVKWSDKMIRRAVFWLCKKLDKPILKLTERAKKSADHAYVPFTNNPTGCALLVDENLIFGGCNIENSVLNCSADAGEVAVYKAISEGYTNFRAICFYSKQLMPFPSGKVRQLLAEFNQTIQIITATDDTYNMNTLNELLPFAPETPDIE